MALLQFAAAIADGQDAALRAGVLAVVGAETPGIWVEELVLQSVLMVGWPRALAAAGVWREVSGTPAPHEPPPDPAQALPEWMAQGEATCRAVYGSNYDRLRANVRALHPALDLWMVTEGYGRTLSRPGLDLRRRELCTVAQCAVQGALPQLHSHLRGARHAGAVADELRAAVHAADPYTRSEVSMSIQELLERVAG